MIGYKIFK